MNTIEKTIQEDKNLLLKMVLFLGLTVGLLILPKMLYGQIAVQDFFNQFAQLGLWGPLLFMGLYILISGILIPSIVFRVFAGVLFGILGGVIYVSIAAAISSLIKFFLARYFFRNNVLEKIKSSEKLLMVDHLIEERGWKILLLLRNIPALNMMFLNYICGVTKMPARDFFWGSLIGRLPTTLMYVYLGHTIGYSAHYSSADPTYSLIEKSILGLGLVASIIACYYLHYLSKKVILSKAF